MNPSKSDSQECEQVFENIQQLDAALLRGDITSEDHVVLARAQAIRARFGLEPTVVLEAR